MSERTDKVISLLEPLGFSSDEARVYLVLVENGAMSALQMARSLRTGRTKVYRVLDTLIAKELVVQEFDEAGFKFLASPGEKLELLVARREGEVAALRKTLPEVQRLLSEQVGTMAPGSKVLYYRGKRGLAQVNWNLTRARGEFLSMEVANANAYMSEREAEKLRRELMEHRIRNRLLTNQRNYKLESKVEGYLETWGEFRYVDPEVLKIQMDVFIYNDVYAVCHYLQDGDVFCVEMVNEKLAAMQREMFEVLWVKASEVGG
jgi:predicted transcriptional regulator